MPDDVHRFRAAHVVTPGGVLDDAVVEVRGERVASVAANAWDERAERLGGWVVPGFVDTHVHGGGGHDYATTDPAEALAARDFHARHGTTTSFASLVTASVDDLCAQLDVLADLVADGHLAGVHLEGPFLSADQAGAHEPSLLRAPDPATVDRLVEAGRGALRLVTLAPELRGGLSAVRRFVAAGVHVAVGHTTADDAMVVRALEAGADVGTHVFSAKVRDLTELLVELGPRAPRHPVEADVAYHDACHLRHAQQVTEAPRAVLGAIPGLRVLEIDESEVCCGSAGIYNLVEPEAAERLGARKAEHVLAVHPDAVATANAGCLLQLRRHLDAGVPLYHPAELLDASIRGVQPRGLRPTRRPPAP